MTLPQEVENRSILIIGLMKNDKLCCGYLHDGRANTIEEAVLWHDGEAQGSQQDFMKLIKRIEKI